MSNYATEEDILTHGFQLAERDRSRASSLCEFMSRLFDRAAAVPPSYFGAVAADATAAARIFWGDGTDFLKLFPYKTSSITTVSMPSGWTVPTYLEMSSQADRYNGYDFGLIRTYGDNDARLGLLDTGGGAEGWAFAIDLSQEFRVGWPPGVKVTVTAKWGYDAVPADVKLAVVESVIAGMRGMDQAYQRTLNLETNVVTNASALTPRATMIAEQYRMLRASFA